jgi:CYTH domain-containing protein/predicted ATPase
MAIHRIVLTGGPCGGKTTALAKIQERLASLGFGVYLVPEAATMLITGGASFAGATPQHVLAIETGLLRLQLSMEDEFRRIAESAGRPAVIICDRGAMDVSAYLPPSTWQALLDENDWTVVGLRDRRYDAVVHLVTAADGAESFYTTANNTARTETPEQARTIDRKLRESWLGHPHLRIIDNSTDFAGKMKRVLQAICGVTGIPEPVEIERKYLVKRVPTELPVSHEEVEIEQTYLQTGDGSEARVRRRGQRGAYVYTHTIKKPLKSGQRVEVERPISGREYVGLLATRDPLRKTIRKKRTCFLWEGLYFELDRFIDPKAGLVLLEVELEDEEKKVAPPPWLEIERDVTDETAYSNYVISAS